MLKISASVVAMILAVAFNLVFVSASEDSASAADLSEFSAGNVIDDAIFFNGNAMTASEVQAFLNSQVTSCAVSVCLKNYSEQTDTRGVQYDGNGSQICSTYTGAASETAAQIIAKVGKVCNVSQKALLVLLQKEQSLVTSRSPSAASFRAATGFGCYDNGLPCDATRSGFFEQVWSAAKQFQNYGTGSLTWYPVGSTKPIQYHPNKACGTRSVFIQNRATAALYYYTPYTPNDAVLKGKPDGCSSYGNLNFFKFFEDWGWSTHLPKAALYSRDASGGLWLYRGSSSAGWLNPVQVGTGWQNMNAILNVGDFNSDGKRDLVTLDSAGALKLFPTDGGTGWGSVVQLANGWDPKTGIISPGDFDENGTQDIMSIDLAGDLWLHRGNGKSGFLSKTKIGTGWAGFTEKFGAGDWNGDKHQDVIVRQTNGDLILYPGNGSGGFFPKIKIGNGWQSMTSISMFGDYNGDRKNDLVARNSIGDLYLYTGNGSGGFLGSKKIGNGWASKTAMVGAGLTIVPYTKQAGSGDIEADGKNDVLAVNTSNQMVLYRGSGTGSWLGTKKIAAVAGITTPLVSAGDLNQDGLPDFVWKDAANNLQRISINRDGSVGPTTQIGNGWSSTNLIIGPGDINSDGIPDLLARDTSGKLLMYPGNGTGGLKPAVQVGNGWSSMKNIVATGDFDSDNKNDIVAIDSLGKMMLYRGNGSGGWLAPAQIGNGWNTMDIIFSPGDFSGDGKADIISRQTSTGKLFLYSGDGYGGWKGSGQIGSGWSGFKWVG